MYPLRLKTCILPVWAMRKQNSSSERIRSYIWILHIVRLSAQVLRHTIWKYSETNARCACENLPGIWLKKGAMVLISNSDPKNTDGEDDFFDTLYRGWNIRRVWVPRLIGSKTESRGKVTELLISNF